MSMGDSYRRLLGIVLLGAVLCPLAAWSQAEAAPTEKPAQTVIPSSYKRSVKRLGGSSGRSLAGSRKGLTKSLAQGQHTLSSRSFSSQEYRAAQASKLRAMHQQAFGSQPDAVESDETGKDAGDKPAADEADGADKAGENVEQPAHADE